jgi:hypothetical protein
MHKKQLKILAVFNVLGYIAMITVNALANILPLNGQNTGQLADKYPNLFVPAGLTFSIWGVIYLLLLLFVIYNFIAISGKRHSRTSFIRKISLLFFVSCLLNAAWIFAWHYQQIVVSVIIMGLLLLTLIFIYSRLEIGQKGIVTAERYMAHLPFSIYLGWISIATIANVTALLVDSGWGRWGLNDEFWTILMMFIGTALAVLMAFLKKDIYYGLVIMWALGGILIKRMVTLPSENSVVMSTSAFICMIALVLLIQLIRRKVY